MPQGKILNIGFACILIVQFNLLYLGYLVGHSGGELVYRHGAAKAYTPLNDSKDKNKSF